jgi:hypothetical protein
VDALWKRQGEDQALQKKQHTTNLETMITTKYRITSIENLFFVERKISFLPWRKVAITNKEDDAFRRLKIFTGSKQILWEQP